MKKTVRGLAWAMAVQRPPGISVGRPRGRKALGIKYEREVAKWLPAGSGGLWWEYRDASRRGCCQTDFLLQHQGSGTMVVLELKNTWKPEAHLELEKLYLPVVRAATRRLTVGIVVVRGLTPEAPKVARVCNTLQEAFQATLLGRTPVLHWFAGELHTQGFIAPGTHLAAPRVAA